MPANRSAHQNDNPSGNTAPRNPSLHPVNVGSKGLKMGIISCHLPFPALLTFQKRYFIIFNHQSLEHRNCLFARKTNQYKATSFPNAYISAKKQNKTCHSARNTPSLRCLFLRYLKTHRPLSANSQIMKHHRHAAFQLTSDSNHEHTNIHNPLTALPPTLHLGSCKRQFG